MVGKLLLRGMLVGLVAGILAFAFARVYGEPQVDKAIAFEEQQAQAAGEAPEPEMVSRATQAGIGLAAGLLVYGAALGGLILGTVETFVNGSQWSTYKDAIAFAILIIILLFRPAGLLGKFRVEKV